MKAALVQHNKTPNQTTAPLKGTSGQVVFRAHPRWSLTQRHKSTVKNTTQPDPVIDTARSRRHHTKSRTGCRNCKARRIKCDERRDGGCVNCESHGLSCTYLRLQPMYPQKLPTLKEKPPVPKEKPAVLASLLHHASSHPSPYVADSTLPSPLTSSLSFLPSLPIMFQHTIGMTETLAILHHFNTLTSHTCGSPQGQAVIQSYMLGVAMQTPYLLHALLGVGAAHLAYLLPAASNLAQNSRNKLADAYHSSQACRGFREELETNGPRLDNMDALLSTIMLVAVHQFILREDTDAAIPGGFVSGRDTSWHSSFVYIENEAVRERSMQWLTIQNGFKTLLLQLERHLARSVWLPVLLDATVELDPDSSASHKLTWQKRSESPPDDVEKAFCRICDIDTDSDKQNNVYYASLENVLHMRRMRPLHAAHFNKIITFMGNVTLPFRKLLLHRDPAALLILAHWLCLVIELQQWWLLDRAERECRAIATFLRDRYDDENVSVLLREPMQKMNLTRPSMIHG